MRLCSKKLSLQRNQPKPGKSCDMQPCMHMNVMTDIHVCMYVCSYKSPTRQKLYGTVLDRLYELCRNEQRLFLARTSDDINYGRALTGDGATIQGNKFINFLCFERGKGAMLCDIVDCTSRLEEAGSIQATYIAHNMLRIITCVIALYLFLILIFLHYIF